MRETIDTTELHEEASELVARINRRQQRRQLNDAIEGRRRTGRALAATIIVGIFLLAALVISLTGCIPATPIGRPTPQRTPIQQPTSAAAHTAEKQPTSTTAHGQELPPWTPTLAPGATPTPRCIVDTGGIEPGTVNVRSGPGMNYQVVDVVEDGDELPLYGPTVNGWQQTTTPQLVAGWFYVRDWCKEER